jgi:hypothetical protein
MGNKIIIPDLNSNGAYGLASFKSAGYRWLVAVPLMTYRVYGLLGAASKKRKALKKETADLIMVIAGLIANALSKAHMTGSYKQRNRAPELTAADVEKDTPLQDTRTEIAPITPSVVMSPEPALAPAEEKPVRAVPEKSPPKRMDPAFHSHSRKMETFKKAHRKS